MKCFASILAFSAILLLAGCAGIVSSATSRLADNLSSAIMNQNDPETVRDGAPSYLLLVDSLIQGDPESESLLITGAKLYGAYASVFVEDPERAKRLSERAKQYGTQALCLRRPVVCEKTGRPYDEFEQALTVLQKQDVPALYACATSWAGWIQANSDDWNAVADLAKVEAMIRKVVELDEAYEDGSAHLYLGMTSTLLPPAYGGKPEVGREHFERAIELSGGRNLMMKVAYAKSYARLVFDRELHDGLCREVLEADPEAPGLTLINILAQREAKDLLESSDEFF